MIPFTMEVRESAHQIPSSPIPAWVSSIASGILEPVRIILMILQSFVIPRPDSAPMVISSIAIKASLKPMIVR